MRIRKAVIPVAGLGTRFLPATKSMPKEMLPIVDKPTIQYILEEAVASGITDVLLVTGRTKKSIEDHFDYSPELEQELLEKGKQAEYELIRDIADMARIHFIRQKSPLGLGHAIGCARSFVGNEPFAVLLGDDVAVNEERPVLGQLIQAYEACGASIIGVSEVERARVSSYGVIAPRGAVEPQQRLIEISDLVEKPQQEHAPSNYAIFGRYVLTPAIFPILATIPRGAGEEIQLTDALRVLVKQERLYALNFEGKRYDIGQKLGFLKATVEFALKREELREPFEAYLRALLENIE